jgi:hypothetical protein
MDSPLLFQIIAAQPYMEVGRWLLNRLSFELADVQAVIEPAPIEQRLMCALLDDPAMIDHDHLIGIADRAQPVSTPNPKHH